VHGAVAAVAQSPARVTAAPRTLDKALSLIDWNAAAPRGPLLVLDPQNVRRRQAASTRQFPFARVAAHFGRKVVPVGSLSVLAPTTMVVLNTRPPVPRALAGMGRTDKLRLLLASLRPDQWSRLAASAAARRGWGGPTWTVSSRPCLTCCSERRRQRCAVTPTGEKRIPSRQVSGRGRACDSAGTPLSPLPPR
jgi:hypothetical protein